MIEYISFNEKGSVKKSSKPDYPALGKKDYLLLFLSKPTKEEIDKIASDFKFDPKPLTRFSKEMHSRRYITSPFQFVMRSVFIENNRIDFTNLLFILTERCLIVASAKESSYYNELLNHTYSEFKDMKIRGICHIFCHFLQDDIDENYEVLGKIEEEVKKIEFKAAAFEKENVVKVEDIMYFKSQLYKLSRQFWATNRVISLIRMGVAQIRIDEESRKLLGDIHETFLHQLDVASAEKEMLSDALTIYSTGINNKLAVISNDLNLIVKRLSGYAFLLLVPTLIASIFGMNFKLPFEEHVWGFYIINGIILLSMILSFVHAKKNNWI